MKKFLLKPEHIRLLRHTSIRWEDCEWGAPAVDCKRPYGDGNIHESIAEILGWDYDEDEGLSKEQRDYAWQLHKETQTALQIIVQKHLVPWGTYMTTSDYGNQWERNDNK